MFRMALTVVLVKNSAINPSLFWTLFVSLQSGAVKVFPRGLALPQNGNRSLDEESLVKGGNDSKYEYTYSNPVFHGSDYLGGANDRDEEVPKVDYETADSIDLEPDYDLDDSGEEEEEDDKIPANKGKNPSTKWVDEALVFVGKLRRHFAVKSDVRLILLAIAS